MNVVLNDTFLRYTTIEHNILNKMIQRFFLTICFFISVLYSNAQELNARVTVNYDLVKSSNNQVFTALEKDLTRYINTTKWTSTPLEATARINCNFSIIINSVDGPNDYSATLVIQSNRPVFNTNYTTPILNIQDKDFKFKYTQFQALTFNPNSFSGNLVDVITYYVYIVLGYDADTFSRMGGSEYFSKAQSIVNKAQNQGYDGWNTMDTGKSRFTLASNLLNTNYNSIREMNYTYHRLGLDTMYDNPKASKQLIANNILNLSKYQNNSAFAYILDVFIDSKESELVKMFSDGDAINTDINTLKQVLNGISPAKSDSWNKMK